MSGRTPTPTHRFSLTAHLKLVKMGEARPYVLEVPYTFPAADEAEALAIATAVVEMWTGREAEELVGLNPREYLIMGVRGAQVEDSLGLVVADWTQDDFDPGLLAGRAAYVEGHRQRRRAMFARWDRVIDTYLIGSDRWRAHSKTVDAPPVVVSQEQLTTTLV